MINVKNKLATKLLLFVLTASLILIGGSFTYFYFSGKSYITSTSIKELENYSKRFNKTVNNQIAEYSNFIISLQLTVNPETDINEKLVKNVENILSTNSTLINKIYLEYEDSTKSIVLSSATVLFGEQIINRHKIKTHQFDSLYNAVSVTTINNSVEFGYIKHNYQPDYYLRKKNKFFNIIIELSNLSFYENVLNKIYYNDEIDFCIGDLNNTIIYSTNKFWINQKVRKYFRGKEDRNNFFIDEDKKIIYGKWFSDILENRIIISRNFTSAYNSFRTLLNNILIYSIAIYILIVIFTIIYANKISKSLNKVTAIAKRVGEGDFENKIDIKRNDELGLLIDSFNNMIDELKISYDKLHLTNKELKEKLEELTQTRIELSKKQKLAFIGETISKISHEIQNKISGVSVWVQNLEMQVPKNENITLYVTEIKSSLNSFMEMLRNFKKFYRKPYLEKQKIDLIKIVENIINRYNSDMENKGIEIVKNIECTNSTATLDKNLITEVVENLFVNAIYFTPENSKIEIRIKNTTENIILTICDEGPGITTENYDNIFTPFFTTKSSGSGLGLAIAKNIIEAHNGTIEVIKINGRGACFKITLPII